MQAGESPDMQNSCAEIKIRAERRIGEFSKELPVARGKMHQGSHAPIIAKQLFDKVQGVLTVSFHPSIHKKPFYFNNLMKCGVCDCKVIGEEKKSKYK